MSKFRKDFTRGAVGENAVKVLLNCPLLCYKKNDSKSYDTLIRFDFEILLEGVRRTGEIKRDWMESKTGNLAIEYHNPKSNKPSGLLGTSADFWIVVLENPRTIWATSVVKLKAYCEENKPVKDLLGGDDNAMLWLYESSTILKDCFKELSPPNIHSILKGLLDER